MILIKTFNQTCSTSAASGGNKNGTFRLDFEKSHQGPLLGRSSNQATIVKKIRYTIIVSALIQHYLQQYP